MALLSDGCIKFIQVVVLFSSLLPFFYCMHACTVTRYTIVANGGLAPKIGSRYFPTVMYVV